MPANKNFRGTCKCRHLGFRGGFKFGSVRYLSKLYEQESDAAIFFDLCSIEFFGENAIINFEENRRKYINGEIEVPKTKKEKKKTSKYSNVCLDSQGHWDTRITIDGKPVSLGSYIHESDAALAVDLKYFAIHGETIPLNFPENLNKYKNNEILTPLTLKEMKKIKLEEIRV